MSMSTIDDTYRDWLKTLKDRIHSAQAKAAFYVNYELLAMYWDLGMGILKKEKTGTWGSGLINQLSKDLMEAFPGFKGFSRSNLFYVRRWVLFYLPYEIVPQGAVQLKRTTQVPDNPYFIKVPQAVVQIPWGHNREIITHCKTIDEALFYIRETVANNWTRDTMVRQIKSQLFKRAGAIVHNFDTTLPGSQADLAKATFKSPYNFEFLKISGEYFERDLEHALIAEIEKFLRELGKGFAFIGRQYKIWVGKRERAIDLVFYNTILRAYVLVDLKIEPFQPDFIGNLSLYLTAVDAQLKHDSDQPSIGILLCKSADKVLVEYCLKNIKSPLAVAEYIPTRILPVKLQQGLPTAEELKKKLLDSNMNEG